MIVHLVVGERLQCGPLRSGDDFTFQIEDCTCRSCLTLYAHKLDAEVERIVAQLERLEEKK